MTGEVLYFIVGRSICNKYLKGGGDGGEGRGEAWSKYDFFFNKI